MENELWEELSGMQLGGQLTSGGLFVTDLDTTTIAAGFRFSLREAASQRVIGVLVTPNERSDGAPFLGITIEGNREDFSNVEAALNHINGIHFRP